jgi:hypothetical protein
VPRRAVPKVGAEPSHEVIDEGYADAFVQCDMVVPSSAPGACEGIRQHQEDVAPG